MRLEQSREFQPLEERLMLAGDLLVADVATNRLLRYDVELGGPPTEFVASGSGGLVAPQSPTFGPDGDLYVISNDPGNQRILRFDGSDGTFIDSVVDTGIGGFAGGASIAFDSDGNLNVMTVSALGVLVYDVTTSNSPLGALANADGILRACGNFGPDGNLYVLDSEPFIETFADRIVRFDPLTEALIDEFTAPGPLDDSCFVTFGPDNHLYVPDVQFQDIRLINGTTGEFEGSFGDIPLPDATAFDIKFGMDGNAYVSTDQGVIRLDAETGDFVDVFVPDVVGTLTFFPNDLPPDLEITIDNVPAGALIGENLSIDITVDNLSLNATAANEWDDVFYLSADNVFDPSDVEIGRIRHTGGLAGSTNHSDTLTVAAPDIPAGDYHVITVTDRLGEVADSNRSNNIAVSASTLEVLPRLDPVDPNFTLSVGRTLSSWTTDGLVGNDLTITYSVYNLTGGYVSNVVFDTELETGVTFDSASITPDTINGQQLTWNFGRLGPLEAASVEVTVTLDNPIPLQLDMGAGAAGVVNLVEPVADSANPAVLRTDPIDTNLLAATVDANSDDPFIQAKAAELNQAASAIYDFVSNEIRYEVYEGSLRGARGTLWSSAGNALDQSSLLVALLRASGVPAQYAKGSLPNAASQQLILSIFADPIRIFGKISGDVPLADPANDPDLLAQASEHYWVQFDSGTGLLDADPVISDSPLGTSATTADTVFAEVAEGRRHKVSIRLNREITSPGAGLLSGGSAAQDVANVLDVSFNTVELVGKSLSLGHYVQSSGIGLTFSAVTNRYAPYLIVNQRDGNFRDDPGFTGTEYQEVLTDFPFGNQILTGLFLEVELFDPEINSVRASEVVEKTLFDRIGFVARQTGDTGGLVNVSVDAVPPINNLDIFSIDVAAWSQPLDALSAQRFEIKAIDFDIDRQAIIGGGNVAAADTEIDGILKRYERFGHQTASLFGGRFLADSSLKDAALAPNLLTRTYYDSPRVVVVGHEWQIDPDTEEILDIGYQVDVIRNGARTLVAPGQASIAGRVARIMKGLADSILEQNVLTPEGFETPDGITGAFDVYARALDVPGTVAVLVGQENIGDLELLNIPAEAKSRITQAISDGKIVSVPSSSVSIGGQERIAWLEMDATSGDTIAVLDDGAHAGEKPAADTNSTILAREGGRGLLRKKNPKDALSEVEKLKQRVNEVINEFDIKAVKKLLHELQTNPPPVPLATLSFEAQALCLTLQSMRYVGTADPPVGDLLFSLSITSPEFEGLASGGPPNIAADIVPDPLLSVPFEGALLPTVFKVGFRNNTGQTETFTIDATSIPAGFAFDQSVPSITLAPGEIGEISVCVHPVGNLPAPGTPVSFDVKVTSTSDPGISTTVTEGFLMPAVAAATVVFAPVELATSPGVSVQTDLVIRSVGNVPVDADFDVELSADVTLMGLTSATINPGQSVTQTLTLTPSVAVPLNSSHGILFNPQFGDPDADPIGIVLQVAAPGAVAAANGAAAARQLGNEPLGRALTDLSVAMTNVIENLGTPVFKAQAVASANAIVAILNAEPELTPFSFDIEFAKDDLEFATTNQECLDAINALATALDPLADALETLARNNFDLFLFPNSQIAQPQVPQDFDLRIQNIGLETTTYDVSVLGVPPQVTSQLSDAQVTLDSGEIADVTLTLTQTTDNELLTFEFQFDVMTNGVPQPISKSAFGTLLTRREVVDVTKVTANPPFVDPGETVNISADILNGVNKAQTAQVSFEVFDPASQSIFTSTPVTTPLTLQTTITNVDLGPLDTTGFALGEYTIVVTVTDTQGIQILGGVGEGRLLVGSPVEALLTIDPSFSQPGDVTVSNTLQINAAAQVGAPLSLVAQIPIAEFTNDTLNHLAINGDVLYVFGDNRGTHVVDISEPRLPQYIEDEGRAANNGVVDGDRLITIHGGSPNAFTFSANSIVGYHDLGALTSATPTDLNFPIDELFPNYQFAVDLVLSGDDLFISTLQLRYNPGSVPPNDIFTQNGTVLSIDVSNPFNMQLSDVLFNEFGGNADVPFNSSGGPFNMFGLAHPEPDTLLIGSTTATGTNTELDGMGQPAVGRILVLDISDPDDINSDPPNPSKIVTELQISGTVQARAITLDGNVAYVVASEGGWKDNFDDISDIGPTGNIVLASIDVTDPRNPSLIHSESISRAARGSGELVKIGDNRFAMVSLGATTDTPQVLIIDTSNATAMTSPSFAVETAIDIPGSLVNQLTTDGEFLYVTSDAGLLVYQIEGGDDIPVTASVQVPNNTGVAIVPGSFNIAPDTITPDPSGDFDTLEWNLTLDDMNLFPQFTWNTDVTDLLPGESREVTLDTTVDFTFEMATDQLTLPPQVIVGRQIVVNLEPEMTTVAPGGNENYFVSFYNPFEDPDIPGDDPPDITYDISLSGIPAEWLESPFPTTINVTHEYATVFFGITPDPLAANGDYNIVVTATNAAEGLSGSAIATLTVEGDPFYEMGTARGVFVEIDPVAASVGLGGAAEYLLTLTNTGSQIETFRFFEFDLNGETGISTSFSKDPITIAPGGTGQTTFIAEVDATATPGDYFFNPSIVSDDFIVFGQLFDDATLTVLDEGVDVQLTPASGTPGSTFDLMVTNNGSVADTFDLSIAGPAAIVATLQQDSVTVNPGATETISVDVGPVDFAFLGALDLVATAQSQSNADVNDVDAASVDIFGVSGVAAAFSPPVKTRFAAGAESFTLLVDNQFNFEQEFMATIVGTTGSVISAALVGLDGQPTQSIPSFLLSSLATGAITLNVEWDGNGPGTVEVEIESLTIGTIKDTGVATILLGTRLDFGDAPSLLPTTPASSIMVSGYPTLAADNGAGHAIVDGAPYLGTDGPPDDLPDNEADGQPNADATGDDTDADGDDEDGVTSLDIPLVAGTNHNITVNVTNATDALLNAWVDFNGDGDWDDAGEQIFTDQTVSEGLNALSFPVPDAFPGFGTGDEIALSGAARFRLSTQPGLQPTGFAVDGEVEDYWFTCNPNGGSVDVAQVNVNTTAAFGTVVLPPGTGFGDLSLAISQSRLSGEVAESLSQSASIPSGGNFAQQLLDGFGDLTNLEFLSQQPTFLFNQNAGAELMDQFQEYRALIESVTGRGLVGSIQVTQVGMESYDSAAIACDLLIQGSTDITIYEVTANFAFADTDYGDAPTTAQTGFASDYPTTLADDGARHLLDVAGPFLGAVPPDADDNGQPDPAAAGDDADLDGDDEDGVVFAPVIVATSAASGIGSIDVTLTNADPTQNLLNAWIDWNADGDWDDADEQIFTDFDLGTVDGLQTLNFTIPQDAGDNLLSSRTFARFRLDTVGGLAPIGPADDGEVEDYQVRVCSDTVVTNTNDAGDGSLREAIDCANLIDGPNSITFNIDGAGPHTIVPQSPLPTILETLSIDGTSQPDYVEMPLVALDGGSAGALANGFELNVHTGSAVLGLAIGGFDGSAIRANGGGGHTFTANFIGTDVTGTQTNGNRVGVNLDGSSGNTVGGATAANRNLLSGNKRAILLNGAGATGNLIVGNFIGTDVTGNEGLGNEIDGIKARLDASNNSIRDNVISANRTGINLLAGSDNNIVQGNRIGTNALGDAALGNSIQGVQITKSSGTMIGGSLTAGEGNLISGNFDGMRISGATSSANMVQGNLIGTDVTGLVALPNSQAGVRVKGPNNTVGSTDADQRNVISGNGVIGIAVQKTVADGNVVQGNIVGLDATGSALLPGVGSSNQVGIRLKKARNTQIGGTMAGAANVISGNANGIIIDGDDSSGNIVEGNLIGTDTNFATGLGNAAAGVQISGGTSHRIGGTQPGAGNVIGGNQTGIGVSRGTVTIQGNFIGTDSATQTIDLGNTVNGISIRSPGQAQVGGTDTGAGNTITNNGSNGIQVRDGAGNAIHRNTIFNNDGLGIDLKPGGVTPNDLDTGDGADFDMGANNLQNFPEITAAILAGANLDITYSIPTTTENSGFPITVEFFLADGDDEEGQMFLGSHTYAAVGSAMADNISGGGATVGTKIVATATDAAGNTSEFSMAVAVTDSQPLLAVESQENSDNSRELTPAALQPIVDAAIDRFVAAGFDADLFTNIEVAIADLPGAVLGLTAGNVVTIDINATGFGWFVSGESRANSGKLDDADSFNRKLQIANQESFDLFATVMHELGHVAGLPDLYDADHQDDLMYAFLAPGARELSLADALDDLAFAELGVE